MQNLLLLLFIMWICLAMGIGVGRFLEQRKLRKTPLNDTNGLYVSLAVCVFGNLLEQASNAGWITKSAVLSGFVAGCYFFVLPAIYFVAHLYLQSRALYSPGKQGINK